MSKLLLSLLLLTLISPAQAAKRMDLETHDLVINKLEGVIGALNEADTQKLPVLLRLGDLYADRARLRTMAEVEKNCTGCLNSKADRHRALALYNRAFRISDPNQQGHLLLQMSHLHQAVGQQKSAVQLLNRIIRAGSSRYGRLTLALAYNGLGEIEYRKGRFAQSKYYFSRAYKEPKLPRRGFALYRLAWSHLNLGENTTAVNKLTALLRSRELLDLGQGAIAKDRNSFHEDVSRDLATFLARKPVNQKKINLLLELSPETTRRANLFYLATEAERLGQKGSAILVWAHYLKSGPLAELESLEIQIRLAQLHFDIGQKTKAVGEYKKATDMWKSKGCDKEQECNELRIRLRNFVTNWNRLEKKNPSPQLLLAYQYYGALFPRDVEMAFWLGQIAQQKRQWKSAQNAFNLAANLAESDLKKGKSHLQPKALQRLREGSLLGEVESAEATKQPHLKLAAYGHYLLLLPNGNRAMDIRYQIAHVHYEQGKHRQAAGEFKQLALTAKASNKVLGRKSADLALDSLVLSKNDQELEKWALELASHYPGRRIEYLRIARKSAINQAVLVINKPKMNKSDQAKALQKLSHVNLAGATEKEKAAYYKNQMTLAVRTRNLEKVRSSARNILNLKGVSSQDRDQALRNLIWVAELKLEFVTAYTLTRDKLTPKTKRNRTALLRLAMLAELSGRDPSPYYLKYLEKTRSVRQANMVRLQMVRRARWPWPQIDKQLPQLRRTPDLLAQITLETFGRFRNYGRAQKILKLWGVKNSPAGKVLSRQLIYRDLDRSVVRLTKHRLNRRSDSRLQKSIRQRISRLGDLEKLAATAIRGKDWTIQVLSLNVLANENRRFHKELTSLPAPKGLTKKQRKQYQKILGQQAAPYQRLARDYSAKVKELWGRTSAISQLEKDLYDGRPELRQVVKLEIKRLSGAAPNAGQRLRLRKLAKRKVEAPRHRDVKKMYVALKSDPFNRSLLQDLRSMEERRGSESMVAFLDSRLKQINREKRK